MRHRFYVSADQVRGASVTFSAAQWHQIQAVLRLRPGDAVRIFDGLDPFDQVAVLEGHGHASIQARHPQPREPRTRLTAYPSLLQRDRFEVVLQKLTELGAAAIAPVLTARSLVRQAPDEQRQVRWQAILREASEQSGRGVVPRLLPSLPFAQALQQAGPGTTTLMAWEGERQQSIRDALVGAAGSVATFVGPEGGFDDTEVARARSAGARIVSLGPRILRAETASIVLATLVLHELGDLSSPEHDQP